MEKIYNVDERFVLIDENLRKMLARQQVIAHVLSALIVSTGNKVAFEELVESITTSDESMSESFEEAKTIMLKHLSNVHGKP